MEIGHNMRRIQWTQERHTRFMEAFNRLGGIKSDLATPKNILIEMNREMYLPELSWKHISSHLQKVRAFLKKKGQYKRFNRLARLQEQFNQQHDFVPGIS
nr:myb family transcription factor PHL7-like [Ipomoea batatas]GME17424.1 myb family transcription factor PHL7-like [Ipomoea batatas]